MPEAGDPGDVGRVPDHRHREALVGAVLGDLEAAAVVERDDHRERAAQRRAGVGRLVAQPDPPAAGEVHDQVQRRRLEVDELAAADAAVERAGPRVP